MNVDTSSVSQSISTEQKSKNREKYLIGPLAKGEGHTLGNALRRTLRSSVTGCAVIDVKIEGVLHEYSTLEGVQEDVLNILLNLKEAAFSLTGNREKVVLKLRKTGIGPVKLDDIEPVHDVELINPEHVIAYLTKDRTLEMYLTVKRGVGERLIDVKEQSSEENENSNKDINTLHLSAVFNPIKNVVYDVKPAQVGERIDLDELIIDLETNGTIHPKVALREATAILQASTSNILEMLDKDLNTASKEIEEEKEETIDTILLKSVDILALSPRASNCLKAENIHFIGNLVTKTQEELLLTPHLGKRSLSELVKKLELHGLKLGTTVNNWPPPDLVYPNENAQEIIEN